MLKITKINGTKLTHKIGTLEKVSEKGFLIRTIDEDDIISLELIKEQFLGKEVKITIEEITKDVVEV